MPGLLRLLAVTAVTAAAVGVSPAAGWVQPQPFNPYSLPTCNSPLPTAGYPDPSWTYSHQCHVGSTVWYVYVDFRGRWILVSSQIMP